AKTVAKGSGARKTIKLAVPKTGFHGYATVTDNGLQFDNSFYFSMTTPRKSRVLSIGEDSGSGFMQRIFTADEFEYSNSRIGSLDYNAIGMHDAVILNELAEIPAALETTLEA